MSKISFQKGDLDVSQVGLSHHGSQSVVILSPEFQCRLHISLPSGQFLLELQHDVEDVLVHDGGVGISLRSGNLQLDLTNLQPGFFSPDQGVDYRGNIAEVY